MKDEAKTKELLTKLRELRQHLRNRGKQSASSDHAKLGPRGRVLKAGQTETDQSETNDTGRLSHDYRSTKSNWKWENEELRNGRFKWGVTHKIFRPHGSPVGYPPRLDEMDCSGSQLDHFEAVGVEGLVFVGSPLFVYIVKADRDALYSHSEASKDKAHGSCEVRF